ncbi:MAG: 16S rRNA (guanine(527)-N(7))-methyltransferase RsmG [Anaerolineae bacterium]|nr:16S rRNA (guanine(527)-N(7))-methyltransferase RsmG [Anaerolineae bacterium]
METLARTLNETLRLDLTADQQRAFRAYAALLLEWNAHTNLTAITEPAAIETKHFLDSLTLLRAVRPTAAGLRVVDVGSGAGFPGVPLKVVFPHIKLTLVEATGKKADFLEHLTRTLGLRDVKVVNCRAEECGQDAAHRERYDLALARAVAAMPTLAEYLLPLCRVGGQCVAYKGESAPQEAAQAENALRILGGQLRQLVPIELPGVAETRYLIVIDKRVATPERYPRRPGIPAKRPLS